MCILGALGILILLISLCVERTIDGDGIVAIIVAFAMLCIYCPVLFLPRKPWVWTYNLVVICLGMSNCCFPVCIPLLIFWIKPEAKQYFERSA
jgi:cyanate permease